MTYQLRQMVLLNAGTNQGGTSGRITAIDPRGGAAVLGDNGVGKTTTLRILPLFFGHLPGQIVSTGQGQEPMVGFLLPSDTSAIAFEYQRGNGEDDLRLAVIRRRHDLPDVPFYRLYRCGFRKDLFVEDGRFLSDDETQKKATEAGVQTTGKLNTNEYRCVILRVAALSQEKDKLRRHSLEWSFGPKSLDNLDRLVAAMVKEHINFADIVQVAIGLVQQHIGHGSETKLTFKQGRGNIQRWLNNRDACLEAFKLAPKVGELENALSEHRAAEAALRSRRADTSAVRAARGNEITTLEAEIEKMEMEWQGVVDSHALERSGLQTASALTSTTAATAKQAYETQQEQAVRFEKEDAARWEGRIAELPALRQHKLQLETQVESAESKQAEATARYERQKNDATAAAAALIAQRGEDKQPHRDRLEDALRQITLAEDAARTAADGQAAALHDQLSATREPLIAQQASWQVRKDNPTASSEAVIALELAATRLDTHKDECAKAVAALNGAKFVQGQARQDFVDQERAVREAKGHLGAVNTALEAAKLQLNPTPGTLLAALRNHSDDRWKRDLSKVIDPALLARDDLSPTPPLEADGTVFGWQLDTSVLATPDWTDNAFAQDAFESAQRRANAALAALATAEEGLVAKSQQVQSADTACRLAQAASDLLAAQTDTLRTQAAAARQRVDSEKKQSQTQASSEISRLAQVAEGIRAQVRAVRSDLAAEQASIKRSHDQRRLTARKEQDVAIFDIDKSIARLKTDLQTQLKSLDSQLAEHLSGAGVDVKRLAALKSQVLGIARDIEERDAKVAMVQSWRAWVLEGGATQVETLRAAAERTAGDAQKAAIALSEFDTRAAKSANDYRVLFENRSKRHIDIGDELKVLDMLEPEFGDYQALGTSVLDPATKARELRGLVQDARSKLDTAADSVARRAASIRGILTVKDSAVKELVELTLAPLAVANLIVRAEELCRCYKQIGPQVATDVNLVLKTLLAHIGAFQKEIQTFEREVASFNKRLQLGLSSVRCFERIKDLNLNIITNFESLGFYRKLARMDDILREAGSHAGVNLSTELPSDETARALGDFMNVLGTDGTLEINLSSHIALKGSLTDNGKHKEFKRASELEHISSEGLTNLVLITLMTALLNTIRGSDPVHVPWVTDEVGRFDSKNFRALMTMLQENRIDVVTASPELGPAQQAMFARHYVFEDRGRIRECVPRGLKGARAAAPAKTEETLS